MSGLEGSVVPSVNIMALVLQIEIGKPKAKENFWANFIFGCTRLKKANIPSRLPNHQLKSKMMNDILEIQRHTS